MFIKCNFLTVLCLTGTLENSWKFDPQLRRADTSLLSTQLLPSKSYSVYPPPFLPKTPSASVCLSSLGILTCSIPLRRTPAPRASKAPRDIAFWYLKQSKHQASLSSSPGLLGDRRGWSWEVSLERHLV